MSPDIFLAEVLDPGLNFLASIGGPPVSQEARVFLLAVALQESDAAARYQSSPADDPGPARGYWQFEQGGGVSGVLGHAASQAWAFALCDALNVEVNDGAVWRALEGNDLLSAGFARLLLYTDPYDIPTDQDAAWTAYADRLWRPGKPHPEVWPDNWQTADTAVATAPQTSAAVQVLMNVVDVQEAEMAQLQDEMVRRRKIIVDIRNALRVLGGRSA